MNSYQLGSVIGKGSEGIVHAGTHDQMPHRKFAIKRINLPRPDHRGLRKPLADRIHKEAEIQRFMATVSRRVIPVHDVHFAYSTAHIVMDLADAGTLGAATHILTETQIKHVLYDVACALRDCHNNGICYGDVKPENIGLTYDTASDTYSAKLFDFGCSMECNFPTSGCKLTRGTLDFAPPELVEQKVHGYNVDLFSFAVMTYYLLTNGHLPWNKLHFRAWEPSFTRQYEHIPSMRHFADEDIADLLTRALNIDPKRRPSSGELVRGLTRWGFHPHNPEDPGLKHERPKA